MSSVFRIDAAATAVVTATGWQAYTGKYNNPASPYSAIRFAPFPESMKLRTIESVTLHNAIKVTYPAGQSIVQRFFILGGKSLEPIPPYTGTTPEDNTGTGSEIFYRINHRFDPGEVFDDFYTAQSAYGNPSSGVRETIARGIITYLYKSDSSGGSDWTINSYYGVGSSKAPYLEVTVSDTDAYLYPKSPSPASGYINDEAENIFTWDIDISQEAYDRSGLDSGMVQVFQWSSDGGSTWRDIAAPSGAKTLTVAANTFPASGSFKWRIKLTDGSGHVAYTAENTLQSYKNITFTSADINPASGFIQEKSSKVFTFSYNRSATDFSDLFLSKSTFELEWKTDSSATATVAGNSSSVTVPANTFPQAGTFQARAKLTTPNGVTTYSSWKTYSTDEPLSTATAVSPSNTVKSDEEDVLFEWIHNNAAGTEQNGATLQWSTDGTTWQTLSTISGSSQSASISLSGKPAGTIYWRVATRNSDNKLGSYSSAVSFVFIAAPAPPAVSVNPWPRARIQWQSTEQQAYRITVDGVEEITAFGNAMAYTLLEALPDGEHTVTVSIQGQYGLWSAPAAAIFTVKNIETAGVILSGKSGIDNVLIWDDTDPYANSREYDIYRDGELIAIVETMGNAQGERFVDKYANGKHAYKVRRIEAYYTDSNEITLTGGSCETVIGELDGEDYIPLTLTDTSDTAQTFSWRKTAVTRHFEGAEYPVIETSDFSDRYANYTVAFTDLKCAEAFEALRGKTVIIKSRAREMMVGVLTEFEKRVGNFYITYSFSIQQIHTPKIDDRR